MMSKTLSRALDERELGLSSGFMTLVLCKLGLVISLSELYFPHL